MKEVLGNKGSSGDAPGMQEALGDGGKRGAGATEPSKQEQGMGQGSLLSPGCLLRAPGNQWLRTFLDFGITASKKNTQLDLPTTHHSSHLTFWLLHHPVGTLWAA